MANRYNGDPFYNNNNPFLNLLEEIEPQRVGPQVGAPAAAQQETAKPVKLPEFWPHAPGIWFARAELRFEVSNVIAERQKFAYTVDALPYESLCLVADLVESPPEVAPYSILKDRLLMSHQLSPVQKAMKLMALPELGNRRPSQMLADLLQVCPPGEHATAFFRASFLQRLPADIQVHLAQADTVDLKELAQRADQLLLTHRRPLSSMMAAVELQEETTAAGVMAAVAGKPATKKKKDRKLITFCWVHHRFGKDAKRCDNPSECQWKEN
jgi:hypothetical protein